MGGGLLVPFPGAVDLCLGPGQVGGRVPTPIEVKSFASLPPPGALGLSGFAPPPSGLRLSFP